MERSDEHFQRDDVNRVRRDVMSLLGDLKGGRGEINVSGSELRGALKDKTNAARLCTFFFK